MNKSKILIVEDEAIVAEDLASKLQRLGYAVAGIAADGEKAVRMARDFCPNLVLMDIRLEGKMDGIEAARDIQCRQDVPIVYLTAHSDTATLNRAKLTGPFGYILKPFEERELVTQIELALYKHKTDRQIREQREWLRVTLTSIGDAVIAAGADGRVDFMNPVAESLTGWKAEESIGRPVPEVFRIVNEKDGRDLGDPVEVVLREKRIVPLANHAALVSRDGRLVPVEDSAAPILDAAGSVVGAVLVFHDVTEKRRAEEALLNYNAMLEEKVAERTATVEKRASQLRRLALELSETEDRERKKIALILHDDLQQHLAAIRFHLQMLMEEVEHNAFLRGKVRSCDRLIDECLNKCRSLSHELSPPVLHQSGLFAALDWLTKDMEAKHGFKVEFKTRGESEPDSPALASLLYRAVRELLFNAVKHSGTDSAVVDACNQGESIRIRVEDKGQGCDPAQFQSRDGSIAGFGLFNIEERIGFMGGRFEIQSEPGKGCVVTLEVPKPGN